MNRAQRLLKLMEDGLVGAPGLIFPESAKFAGFLFTHNNEGFFLCQPKDKEPDPRTNDNDEITNPVPRGESVLGSTLPTGDIGSYGFNWTYPGGGIENGETPYDSAMRECREEIGFVPEHKVIGEYLHSNGYLTYLAELPTKFEDDKVKLNNESTNYGWYGYGDLPDPLHDGVTAAVDSFGLTGTNT
jgi:hypothetical protein